LKRNLTNQRERARASRARDPEIANATFADIEWVVSAYVLTFAALLTPSGALADRFGRQRMLTVGLAIFMLVSLLCGLAPSAAFLNSARALQGVGAAIELSAALAVLGHEFRGAERAKAFGTWGTVIGVAVAVGPLVGGLITSMFGWRWAFLVNIPIGAALVWLAVDAVEESRDPDAQKLDVVGMLSFGGGLFCLIWALIGANRVGWSAEQTLAKLLASAVLFALFVAAELIQERPMVDFALFGKRTFLGASFATGLGDAHQIVAKIVAGDISGVAAQTPEPFRAALAELARLSFASGFTVVLLVAGVTAALAAALTFAFVNPVETAPVRLRAVADTGTSELFD
jgi:MFS family permease